MISFSGVISGSMFFLPCASREAVGHAHWHIFAFAVGDRESKIGEIGGSIEKDVWAICAVFSFGRGNDRYVLQWPPAFSYLQTRIEGAEASRSLNHAESDSRKDRGNGAKIGLTTHPSVDPVLGVGLLCNPQITGGYSCPSIHTFLLDGHSFPVASATSL